jgi:hypothetical protein
MMPTMTKRLEEFSCGKPKEIGTLNPMAACVHSHNFITSSIPVPTSHNFIVQSWLPLKTFDPSISRGREGLMIKHF